MTVNFFISRQYYTTTLGKRDARRKAGMERQQEDKKKPAAPYSRTGGSRTTLGEEALDFRVRNGNGYDSLSMATGKKVCRAGDLKGIAARREGDPCHNEVFVWKIKLSRTSD